MAWLMTEVPTTVTRLDAGPVEYRLEQRGDTSVVIFHGGHMRAGLALGEDVFAEAGHTLLVPSRPGYGRTPLSTGTSVSGFCDVTRALCTQLGITTINAVVGISGGWPHRGHDGGTSSRPGPAAHPAVRSRLASLPRSVDSPRRTRDIQRHHRTGHVGGDPCAHAPRTGHRLADHVE